MLDVNTGPKLYMEPRVHLHWKQLYQIKSFPSIVSLLQETADGMV